MKFLNKLLVMTKLGFARQMIYGVGERLYKYRVAHLYHLADLPISISTNTQKAECKGERHEITHSDIIKIIQQKKPLHKMKWL